MVISKSVSCVIRLSALSLGLFGISTTAWAAPPDVETAKPEASDPEATVPETSDPDPAAAPVDPVTGSDAQPGTLDPAPETADEVSPEPEGPTEELPIRHPDTPLPVPDDQFPSELRAKIGPKHSIVYTNLLAPRINPLGLENRLWIGYKYRLYDKDKTILNGSNISVFVRPIVSPAVLLIGPTLQIQPAAVLRLRASYAYISYFGNFQYFQSYDSPYDDFSQSTLAEQKDAGENYKTTGHQVQLEALFQIRFKGLVVRSSTGGVYNHFNDVRGGEDLFYAVRYDALVPTQGWMLYNDSDLMWLHDLKGPRHSTIIAGARGTTVMPFYKDEVYETGDDLDNPNGPQFRLGPVLGYVFYDRPDKFPRFNKPTLLVMPQWNLKHRWRTGLDISQAMPTIVIAFVFSGELWGSED